jgi:C-terminal processing protease CtpA/Prc
MDCPDYSAAEGITYGTQKTEKHSRQSEHVVRYVYASFRKDGHVHRGQIGIFARTITPPLASAFHIEPEEGVLVQDVTPESPADKAGVQGGDVVLSIDGTDLRNVRDLALQLYQYAIGDTVQLKPEEIRRSRNRDREARRPGTLCRFGEPYRKSNHYSRSSGSDH